MSSSYRAMSMLRTWSRRFCYGYWGAFVFSVGNAEYMAYKLSRNLWLYPEPTHSQQKTINKQIRQQMVALGAFRGAFWPFILYLDPPSCFLKTFSWKAYESQFKLYDFNNENGCRVVLNPCPRDCKCRQIN